MIGSRLWTLAVAAALIAASGWLKSHSVQYLAFLTVATLASVSVFAADRRGRTWAAVCEAGLVAVVLLAGRAQWQLRSIERDWAGWQRAQMTRGGLALRDSLQATVQTACATAISALRARPDTNRARAFESMRALVPRGYERGVVLFRRDSAFAWAGRIRVSVDDAPIGLDVVNSSVYLELRCTLPSGDLRATAVSLIDATPPGDRLATTLAAEVARGSDLAGFQFAAPSSPPDADAIPFAVYGIPQFDIHPLSKERPAVEEDVLARARADAGLGCALALFSFIVAGWRRSRSLDARLGTLGIALVAVAWAPLNEFSVRSRLFDAAAYYAQIGGPFTANAGALGISSALLLLGVIAVIRRRTRDVSLLVAISTVAVIAVVGPFLLGNLAHGLAAPTTGVDAPLWLIWEIPIFLAAVTLLLTGTAAGGAIVGHARGLQPAIGPSIAAVAALLGPIVWTPQGEWPGWYVVLWIAAIVALALSRRTRFMIVAAATVAALAAPTLVWRSTARGRMELAVHDLSGLNAVDPNTPTVLRHLSMALAADSAPQTRQALLAEYVRSELEAAGHPVALSSWPTDTGPSVMFRTASFPMPQIRELVAQARARRVTVIDTIQTDSAMVLAMAVPGRGGVTGVVVAPTSQLFTPDSSVRLYGLSAGGTAEPPYTLERLQREPTSAAEPEAVWRRRGDALYGEWVVQTGTAASRMHIEVDLRPTEILVERGALIVLIDLAIVGVLWFIGVAADGGVGRWLGARRRQWSGSFRARLTLALFGFFVIPAAAFAVWSYHQIATDTRKAREDRLDETLRSVPVLAAPPSDWLATQGALARTPLLLFERGELSAASDPLLGAFAPLGRFVDVTAEESLLEELRAAIVHASEPVGAASILVGFRPLDQYGFSRSVLAAPLAADDLMLDRRGRDLLVLVLVTTVLGGIAAFWLSGIAARELARPIGALRAAALSLAGGAPGPALESEPTAEFRPVFTAFRRMASDLSASRSALEDAQRRTAAVLRNVASGVIAVSPTGTIVLANPRAAAILDAPLVPGSPFSAAAPESLARLVTRFLPTEEEEEAFEVATGVRQLRGQITRLERGGAVVTIDDVTDLARAQRVLAWGEMARQVAHEIKNPLTPIRLGVQHLKRARADGRVDFDRVLDQNVTRILAEIDRLDEIARAFSKYGSGPEDRRAPEPTDIAAVVHDTVGLEQMGADDGVRWEIHGVDVPLFAVANAAELKEVLLNLLENARLANSRTVRVDVDRVDDTGVSGTGSCVRVTVRDDGHGIPTAVLPRIFEPHFSTRTSGSGLGLAISRQLIDGWGGEIDVRSAPGEGTVVTLTLPCPSPARS